MLVQVKSIYAMFNQDSTGFVRLYHAKSD